MAEFFKNLSQDLIKLLETNEEYNVIIEAGEAPATQSFKVHSVILCHRCPILYDEIKKVNNNENNIRVIIKTQISATIFEVIIKYIYSGVVNLENIEASIIFDILTIANQYGLTELLQYLELFILKNQIAWLESNSFRVYQISSQSTSFPNLQNFCNDLISTRPSVLFESNNFESIPEPILISLIQREDLNLEESKIWDYVIKWGLFQNTTLPPEIKQWTNEDFQILKSTLQGCLPHIRYFQISGEDVFKKVQPYKQILKQDIWKDMRQKLLIPNEPVKSLVLPPREIHAAKSQPGEISPKLDIPNNNWANEVENMSNDNWSNEVENMSNNNWSNEPENIPNNNWSNEPENMPNNNWSNELLDSTAVFSTLITYKHAAEISSWIDQRLETYGIDEYPYEFRLLTRGSTFGFDCETFWRFCGGHKFTVVVMRIHGTNEIIGGYNPLEWDFNRNSYTETKSSFIFSLKNGTQNSIISRVGRGAYKRAIFNSRYYGPRFGRRDIYVPEKFNMKNCMCQCEYYENPIRNTLEKFSVDEYEVFQIFRKRPLNNQ